MDAPFEKPTASRQVFAHYVVRVAFTAELHEVQRRLTSISGWPHLQPSA
jgi:hypothetical protein